MLKNFTPDKFLTVLFIALFCFSAKAQETGEINLNLSFADRTLDVRIDIPQNKLDKTGFTLSDWAGVANYAENIYRVSAKDKNGNALPVEKTGARTWLVGNAQKAFALTYTVVSQKDSFMGTGARNHFHPTIFKDYAFLWGMTFLLFPDDDSLLKTPVKLQVNPNEYANYYSNFEGRSASFDDLSEFFVAAGNYRVMEKTIGERRVRFLLQGKDWKFTDEEFAGAVSKIIEAQIRYMGFSPSKDDLLITLTEGTPNSKGGTVVKNVISVYPDPQVGLHDFTTLKLISHEHFHFWNGSLWHDSGDKKEGYYKWLSEGFTEYYAGLTLYRENLITEKEFIAWLNRAFMAYQLNPYAKTATAEVLSEKYWESQDYNRLPYVKGMLLAFLTDLEIRRKTSGKKQIDDLMKSLLSKTDLKKGYDDKLLLAGFDAVLQGDNRAFYNDFMLGARALPLAEIAKLAGINVSDQPQEVFELGFTTEGGKLEKGACVKEVTSLGAIEAGLKTGDELRGFSFNSLKPQEQATFTVQRGSETLQLKYYPKKTANFLQIDENARIPK